MVKKIFTIFHKEFSSVNQAALLLGFFSLLSQLLGLARDRAFAHFIGVGKDLDIYYAAFRIPDFIFVSFGSLFAVVALLPFLTKKINADNGKTEQEINLAQSFFNNSFSFFLYLMILVSILFFFLMPYFVRISFPGFDEDSLLKTISLSRVMLLSPLLLGLSNLFWSVTQFFKKFFVFALCPILYNLGIILGIFFLYPQWGLPGLVFGVLIGAFLHLIIQIPVLLRHKFYPKLLFKINMSEIQSLFRASLPRTAGLALYNLTVLVLLSFASLISAGSISIFNFAFNLYTTPIFIIGVSYSVAAFPTLTRLFSANEIKTFINQVVQASRQIIFFAMPCIILFIVLRAQIVRVILGSGKFSWSDTKLVAATLAILAISVVAQSLNMLLVRAFYAAGDTWRPFWINLTSSIFIVVVAKFLLKLFATTPSLKYFIESFLRVSGTNGTSILMLALAFSFGLILNFFLLWYFFKKDFFKSLSGNVLVNLSTNGNNFSIQKTFWQSLLSSIVMGFVAYWSLGFFDNMFNINTLFGILMQGLLSGILGIIAGIIVLRLLGSEELFDTYSALREKFWKTKVVTTPQENMQ